jgi:folate-binding protein YgfZ
VECDLSDVWVTPMTGIRGEASSSVTPPRCTFEKGVITSWCTWPGSTGFDLYGSDTSVPGDIPLATPEAVEALRIEAGWPASGVDLVAGDVPADAGRAVLDAAVSFTKGCYTGQELVERMDSRAARSPRPLRGLVLNERSAVPPAGAEVVIGGEVVGTVTSAAFAVWRDAPVALARVGRSVAPPCVGVVRWPDGEAGARVVDLPFAPVPSFDRIPSI